MLIFYKELKKKWAKWAEKLLRVFSSAGPRFYLKGAFIMYTMTIPYTDYKGVERSEEFCFNLTRSEIVDMELDVVGGMSATLDKISKSQDLPALIAIFRDLVKRSYGVISADGRRFVKTPELVAEFVQTPAYDEIYMRLVSDADAAAEFVNNIVPAEMAKQVQEAKKLNDK